MRFLAQFRGRGRAKLAVWRPNTTFRKTQVLVISCDSKPTPLSMLVDDPQLSDHSIQTYHYSLTCNGGKRFGVTPVVVEGTFPIVGVRCQSPLRFAFVSCNDNCLGCAWNKYQRRSTTGLWQQVAGEGAHLIVHMGDQIYADSAHQKMKDGTATKHQVTDLLRQLYIGCYSEEQQQRAMQNSLNLMILDDHDVTDGFASHGKYGRDVTSEYIPIALRLYREYQCSLNAKAARFTSRTACYSYAIPIGKYRVILLDERLPMLHHGTAIGEQNQQFVARELADSSQCEILLISPRPFGHLDPIHALSQGLFFSDGVDELLHPANIVDALKMREMLFDHQKRYGEKASRKVHIVSGDVHQTLLQTHHARTDSGTIDELITSGITRMSRSSEPQWQQAIFALQRQVNCLWLFGIKDRRRYSLNANYGLMLNDTLQNRFSDQAG
jgi:hypothetical protein